MTSQRPERGGEPSQLSVGSGQFLGGLFQFLNRMAGTIALFKDLLSNRPALIDKHGAGMRQAVFENEIEGLNRLATFVGEKREGDFFAVAKFLERVYRVVANPYNLDFSLGELVKTITQLNQLPFAKRSPIRRPVKDERYRTFG